MRWLCTASNSPLQTDACSQLACDTVPFSNEYPGSLSSQQLRYGFINFSRLWCTMHADGLACQQLCYRLFNFSRQSCSWRQLLDAFFPGALTLLLRTTSLWSRNVVAILCIVFKHRIPRSRIKTRLVGCLPGVLALQQSGRKTISVNYLLSK